jgi:hypothetical protein
VLHTVTTRFQRVNSETVKLKKSRYTLWRHLGGGERSYSSYSFTTSALDGMSGQRHAPAALYPQGMDPRYPLYRRLGGNSVTVNSSRIWKRRLVERTTECRHTFTCPEPAYNPWCHCDMPNNMLCLVLRDCHLFLQNYTSFYLVVSLAISFIKFKTLAVNKLLVFFLLWTRRNVTYF